MLHYVHHIVTNCVCLFGAGKEVYSGLLERIVALLVGNKVVESDQNNKLKDGRN